MNKKLTIIPCLGILAVMVGASHAGRGLAQEQVPQAPQAPLGTAFTYQGYLTDGDSPANGMYDLRFILYDSASERGQVGSTLEVADLPGAARPLRSTTVDGIPVSEGAPVLGVALGTLDAEGYARVLVNPQ